MVVRTRSVAKAACLEDRRPSSLIHRIVFPSTVCTPLLPESNSHTMFLHSHTLIRPANEPMSRNDIFHPRLFKSLRQRQWRRVFPTICITKYIPYHIAYELRVLDLPSSIFGCGLHTFHLINCVKCRIIISVGVDVMYLERPLSRRSVPYLERLRWLGRMYPGCLRVLRCWGGVLRIQWRFESFGRACWSLAMGSGVVVGVARWKTRL